MEKLNKDEVETFAELDELLTSPILETLKNALQIPARMAEEIEDPIDFLNTAKTWEDYDPVTFHDALKVMGRSDILAKAGKLEWLCTPSSKQTVRHEEPRSVKTLVRMLADDVTSRQWKIIVSQISTRRTGKIQAREVLKLCLENNLITKDLTELSELMERVKRNDIASQLSSYSATFSQITKTEFRDLFSNEIECGESEGEEECRSRLRDYLKIQHSKVSVTFESENTESMEHIYTPLTVVEEVPIVEAESEESSLTEISNIRAMVAKLTYVEEVNFDEILATTLDSFPQLWLMIGSPGSGKTFLCKNIAFRFGISEVSNFQFVLYIPCRSEKWHKMEATRNDKGRIVTRQFVQEWLAISMSAFSKWSESLSKRLVETDGESLLVIIDGVDEFTKKVPFQSTLLSLILRRGLLSRASFLITSRPGAWSQLSHQHGATFRVDSYFQVVGFSPSNRDLYFQKRIPNEQKLSAVRQLLRRHDEINQLALVPVNASLFSSLFNQAASILSYTLTNLYSELVVYIIRRQLSRMSLTAYMKNVSSMSDFHPGIQECIRAIGEEAYDGVFDRHLTSSNAIPLCLDDGDVESERLGLMESCIKEVKVGEKEKVWTFTHLTIQEFMSALFFRANSWSDQCAMIRYLVSSSATFSMFKMVIRFSCGLLKGNTGAIIPILCHKLTPTPMPMHDMPMIHQLQYTPILVAVSDWYKFTSTFLMLATIICETNPETIRKQFCYYYDKYLPHPLYFYFRGIVVSPNEWYCFVQSLRYVSRIKLIHIDTQLISPEQFSEFLHQLSSCSLCYLALFFGFKTSSSLARYTRLLTTTTLPPDTKISIYLHECKLVENVQLFRTNQFVGSLGLNDSNCSLEMLHRLTNQFSSIENIYFWRSSDISDWSILQQSIGYHQVTGLYIRDRNAYPFTPDFLSGLSSLQELYCVTKLDPFALLPSLQSLSRVTFLGLLSTQFPPSNESHRDRIVQLINRNSNSLRHLDLPFLHLAGFHDWSSFLPTLHSCSNLVFLLLTNTKFPLHDISCWYEAVSALRSLVFFGLTAVPLRDEGLWVVCHSLTHHPAIRSLLISSCDLTPESCRTLSCLIQTLPQIRKLTIYKAELFRPDFQLQSLVLAAEECSVEIQLL